MVSPLHNPDLAVLRTHRLESGYHGVYRYRDHTWRAKPFRSRGAGVHYTKPEDAARVVAASWREMYGDDWPAFFNARLWRAWRVHRVTPKHGTSFRVWDGARGVRAVVGYQPVVWVLGERTVLWPKRGVAFATKELAEAHVEAWIAKTCGLFVWWFIRQRKEHPTAGVAFPCGVG